MLFSRLPISFALLILCFAAQIPSLQAATYIPDGGTLYLQSNGIQQRMTAYHLEDYLIVRFRVSEKRLHSFRGYLKEVSGDSIRINHRWFTLSEIEQINLPNKNGKPIRRRQVNGKYMAGVLIAAGIQVPATVGSAHAANELLRKKLFDWTVNELIIGIPVVITVTYSAISHLAIYPLKALSRTKKLGKRRVLVIQ